jgi:hypothetical protein
MADNTTARVMLTPGVEPGLLTRQTIQAAFDLQDLPQAERDDFAREIASRARYARFPPLRLVSVDGRAPTR